MKDLGVFDILGPVMIGPSSSHTAGAARLGKIARTIAGSDIKEVKFFLHGSFGKTYKGHGTDRALVAGILGMDPWDIELRDAIKIAEEKGIILSFEEQEIEDAHPNTVRFVITNNEGKEFNIVGSSIGGGSVKITEVNGNKVEFTGDYPTLIISHKDKPGIVSKVTELLYDQEINIAYMKVFRKGKGKEATMVCELDHTLSKEVINEIEGLDGIEKVICIE